MTEEEQNEVIARLLKRYGDNLPNPEHQPEILMYLAKLYLYDLRLERSGHESE